MNRLFVKIKTDPRLKGTLFEISRKSKVGDTLDQMVNSMARLPATGEEKAAQDYQMIRLGSPKRILEKAQTFAQTGVGNNDTLLITTDAEAIMSQGVFEFEALSLEGQYVSVQDRRAPLRMPLERLRAHRDRKPAKAEPKAGPSAGMGPKPSQKPAPESQESANPFGFQSLGLDLPDPADKTGSPGKLKPGSGASTKKKLGSSKNQ